MIDASEKDTLPEETGVYLFYSKDELLYIGKAKNIRRRVRDHFRSPCKHWISRVERIDFFLLPSEEEALLTERELISSRRPRYNIRLRDDRSYPMIAVSLDEEYPRVYLTREKQREGRLYFGPWTDARRVRTLLRVLPTIYPFRSCTGAKPGRAKNPCLDYYIGRCGAPCVGKVSQEEYREGIQQIILFLSGRRKEAEAREEELMKRAAAEQNFERAALHRDRLRALRKMSDRGAQWGADRDVAYMIAEDDQAALAVLEVREGRIAEKRSFLLEGEEEDIEDVVRRLLPHQNVPLITKAGSSKDKDLLEIAKRAARGELQRDPGSALNLSNALRSLQNVLGLERAPLRIEGYDIANLGERDAVGGMVVFEEGLPHQKDYRLFDLPAWEKPDDYASMRLVLRERSLQHKNNAELSPFDKERDPAFARRPDLLLVDGGPGQLRAAEAGSDLDVPVIALAKREEEVWTRDGKIELSEEALALLQRIRDAVHRFSNSAHQQKRKKSMLRQPLLEIPGIGTALNRRLLEKFSSLDVIREASEEEISSVKGVSPALATSIKKHLRS